MSSPASEDLESQTLLLVEEHVRRLLVRLDFEQATVRCHRLTEEVSSDTSSYPTIEINIEAGDTGKLLIGSQGSHLQALQHIIRTLLRRQLSQPARIVVDVNGYRVKREQVLLSLAEDSARRAKSSGRNIVLRPMEAAERRTIHTALATHQEVSTESMGDEPNRRVVVRPVLI